MKIKGNTVQIGDAVYQLSQINSVRVVPGRFRPLALLMAVMCGGAAVSAMFGPADRTGGKAMAVFMLGVMAAFAVYRVADGLRDNRLMITTSSGEVAAMQSTKKAKLDSIASDLIAVIAARA